MESTNTYYPVFEPDQVLTSDHLNQLRKFLALQDRLSRRLLHGIGVVCGLKLSNPNPQTIRISKGTGITSQGFLVTLDTADCTHYRVYKDKIFNEVNCNDQIEGKYDLFLDDQKKQYKLWELLTSEEELNSTDDGIKQLTSPPEEDTSPLDLSRMCVLLYLEIEDLDMLACFGEDCDEKGIQRHFTVRKLLVHQTDLLEVIKEAHDDHTLSEDDLDESLNAKYKLKPIGLKRFGYAFSNIAKNLSLSTYHDFNTFFTNYTKVIQDGAWDVSKALFNSYEAYHFILKDEFPTNPFKNYDSENANQNPLYIKLMVALKENRLLAQYAYDFLFDLKCAYDEFKEKAFNLALVCCPNPRLFPRHLMLGKAKQTETEPSIYRQHFISSPILGKQNQLLEEVKLYYKRIVQMVSQFNDDVLNLQDIKVTPSVPYAYPLSKRAIPFYYNVNAESKLIRSWNFDKSLRFRSNTLLSYHASTYNLEDEFVSQPMFWENKAHEFLRVEGHVGKNYERALSNLLSQKERLNLPIKIVGVKLSKRFANTNIDVECHFDDLQTLFRTFTTELKCMLFEEAEFFRNLDTELKDAEENTAETDTKKDTSTSETKKSTANKQILSLLDTPTDKSTKPLEEQAIKRESAAKTGITTNINYQVNYDFNYSKSHENTIGYLLDSIPTESSKDPYNSIFNLYATGQLGNFYPGIFIYTILYPIQIATNIDTLLKNVPDKLEDLDIALLKKDYDALVESASGFKTSIQENLNDPKYVRKGNEEVLLYRLDKLIYHCSIKKLVALHQLYLQRIQTVQEKNLFSQFAKAHSGLEHMAGVPKGGTLVLVYIDSNDITSKEQAQDLKDDLPREFDSRLSKNEGLKDLNKDMLSASEKQSGIRAIISREKTKSATKAGDDTIFSFIKENQDALPKEVIDRLTDQLEIAQFKDDELPPNNIVVADFALPYLCCGSCSEIATMVVAQIVFRLQTTEFCRKDSKAYPFTLEPSGGTISGPGVQRNDTGSYFFQPSSIPADEVQQNITLTYLVNNQTVLLNLTIYNPVAAFTAANPEPIEEGKLRVRFTNKSTDADTYLLDFGDGESYDGAIFPSFHDYILEKNGPTVTAKLQVKRRLCTATAEPVNIDLKTEEGPSFGLKKNNVCNNVQALKVYFNTTPLPKNNLEIASNPTVNIENDAAGYFFRPVNLPAQAYTFTYKGINAECTIHAPLSFQLSVVQNPKKEQEYTINYVGVDFKDISWAVFVNGENDFKQLSDKTEQLVLNLANNQLPALVRASVTSVHGCISSKSTEIKQNVSTACFSAEILDCWNTSVVKTKDLFPVERALQMRGIPIDKENQTTNINKLLDTLSNSKNCGFNLDMDINNPKGALNLGDIESLFLLLSCISRMGGDLPGFESSNIEKYRQAPSVLTGFLVAYQTANCCQKPKTKVTVEDTFWTEVPVTEKKKILTNRGVTNIEGKSDDQLSTLIKKSAGGNTLSSVEMNTLGLKTLKGLAKIKNINTTGVTKKADFLNLLK